MSNILECDMNIINKTNNTNKIPNNEFKCSQENKYKYLVHEILNPLCVINNCAELLNINILNSVDKSMNHSLPYKNFNYLLNVIKNQINECSNLSKILLEEQTIHKKINLKHFISNYINDFKTNNINVTLLNNNNNSNKYDVCLSRNEIYLKIIFDNIFKNILKHTNELEISIDNHSLQEKVKIIIKGFQSHHNSIKKERQNTLNQITNTKELNHSKTNKYSVKNNKSHFIGLEIIDNFCCSLNIIWFLEQDKNNNYQYILYLPTN